MTDIMLCHHYAELPMVAVLLACSRLLLNTQLLLFLIQYELRNCFENSNKTKTKQMSPICKPSMQVLYVCCKRVVLQDFI